MRLDDLDFNYNDEWFKRARLFGERLLVSVALKSGAPSGDGGPSYTAGQWYVRFGEKKWPRLDKLAAQAILLQALKEIEHEHGSETP
jgi:hypothetical protein